MRPDLKAIKARTEVATRGWWADVDAGAGYATVYDEAKRKVCEIATSQGDEWTKADDAHTWFIIHAREDIPALVARVEELEGALLELRQAFDEQEHGPDCEPEDDWCECGKDEVLRAIATVLYGPSAADPAPGTTNAAETGQDRGSAK